MPLYDLLATRFGRFRHTHSSRTRRCRPATDLVRGLTTAAGVLIALPTGLYCLPVCAQVAAYNPYADSQDSPPPVSPDGTIHWGTFYKSAALQKSYERLWNLGACRGSNKAITVPVEQNQLSIDSLPTVDFRGVVQGVTGSNSGGAVAFMVTSPDGAAATQRVAVLHPAGVSRVDVSGTAPVAILTPGMTVRCQATVDGKGRAETPIHTLHLVAPATDAKPAPVTPGQEEMIIGRVVQMKRGVLTLRVDAGRIRRLSIPLAEDATVQVASSLVSLAGVGDAVEIKGRLWEGEGSIGDGTVFADKITVTKTCLQATSSTARIPSSPKSP
ncbi:MAG: hypothetical protein DWH79_05585 [Planctomycetota bacterium]|nr:MAG: hypothetical protein DWH79_05585 [Planctomycetota bacterium]